MEVSMQAKAQIEVLNLVMRSAKTLDERLAGLLLTEKTSQDLLKKFVERVPVHNFNGMSGYNYWIDNKLIAQLHFAGLESGYYVFLKRSNLEQDIHLIYDYFNREGQYAYSSEQLEGTPVFYNSINMDPTDPFVNYLYNLLLIQYEQAEQGLAQTQRTYLLERILRSFQSNPQIRIGVKDKLKDPAIINIRNEFFKIENDTVLSWDERQRFYQALRRVKKKLLKTKRRAHKLNYFAYDAPLKLVDMKDKFSLMSQRPFDNFLGLGKKYTWGRVVWFANTVQGNLGLSIAMAIYGPFTFYFITQPMNPHAMWAVGKVRSAYLDTIESLKLTFQKDDEHAQLELTASGEDQKQDVISSKMAANSKDKKLPSNQVLWEDRMSSFKAMQIAYEESMVFAARMGRIEQMENQFAFPLTAESAWEEMERYSRLIEQTLHHEKNIDARYKTFLSEELKRTREHQVYLWRKLGQFFNDHPYMVVDQDEEQTAKDYYIGRGFVFMEKITNKLNKMDLKKHAPNTHEKVLKLAKKYRNLKQDSQDIIGSLEKNSFAFNDEQRYDTERMRKVLKRHWEILFLQQNKKQEASSFGLQTYTWSVRNTLWALQSLYSAKREDIASLTLKYKLGANGDDLAAADQELNTLYESLLNMLMVEFVSIKKEIESNLAHDSEAEERVRVIENIRDSLIARDKLFNQKLRVAQEKRAQDTTL